MREYLIDEDETISYLASRVLINMIESNEWLSHGIHNDHGFEQTVFEINNLLEKLDSIYTSDFALDPILSLLDSETEICIKWACFTLVHLTHNDLNKYGHLIQITNGLNLINSIIAKESLPESIKILANKVLKNISRRTIPKGRKLK